MGGSSKSSSSNSTTSNIDNSNTQINDNQGQVFNVEGSKNNITVTDGGAIENAFDFGESALDTVDTAVDRSLASVDSTVDQAFDFGDTALLASFDFGSNAISEARSFNEFVLNEAQETSQSAINLAAQSQSNALTKVTDLVNSISSGDSERTKQLLIAVAVVLLVLGVSIFLITRKQ